MQEAERIYNQHVHNVYNVYLNRSRREKTLVRLYKAFKAS